jgi:uncharacterized protein (DUF1501 family)
MSEPMNQDAWWSCDGSGHVQNGALPLPKIPKLTRRQAVRGAVAATLSAWLGRSALSDAAFGAPGDDGRDILVTVFLRGGADGLSLVVPHGDDDYFRLRPTIGIGKTSLKNLDGFFGLHPSFEPIHPFFTEGSMAVVHAVGSGDATRSHFEAMATMERGMPDDKATGASGWLARYLSATPPKAPSPLRAVSWGPILQDILRGATDVSTLSSLEEFRLDMPHDSPVAATLASLYQKDNDEVSIAGRETLAVLDTLRRVDPKSYKPQNGAVYPTSGLGDGLRQVALLLRANVGMEVACLDRGGWDTHITQGGVVGYLSLQIKDVADSLSAFVRDLGPTEMRRVTILVMTEFGRRVPENSGLGTDHGRASAMLLIGGNVNGGKVYAKWPGLKSDQLEPPGDLRVTTDYRDVLAEVVANRLNGASVLPSVFPNFTPSRFPGIVRKSA